VIVADTWYRAKTALELMPKTWDNRGNDGVNSEDVFAAAHAATLLPGGEVVNEGDLPAAMAAAATTVTGTFQSNYTPHACMEPMGYTVSIANGRADCYGSTQNPPGALAAVADQLGMEPENVYQHTTFLGGGFGRRSRNDDSRQAAEIAKQVGRPVKMTWSREEDIIQGKHRPYSVARFVGALDASGNVTGMKVTAAAHSLTSHTRPSRIENGIDRGVLTGIRNMAYNVPNQYMDMHMVNTHIPLHYWRAVNSTQNNWQIESFIDELAQAGGKDPLQLRKELTADLPQYQRMLTMLGDKAGWTTDLPRGTGMGIGISEEFSTPVMQCATVSVSRRGTLTVEKIVAVVDCGHLVNPEIATNQVESAIVYGLSFGWTGDLTIRNGIVQENNFDTFQVPRISQMPVVEVHFSLSRGETWGGMGEPATPAVTSAVANAIFYATGKRVRKLPFAHANLSWG
jgi:isoquinoline 1-oxidoreductase beta subunit